MIGAGDRLRIAWEYCRPKEIYIPHNPRLERSLKQCKEFNLKYWTPKREKQLLKTRELIRQGARQWRELHGKEPWYLLYNRIRLLIQAALKRRGSGKRGRHWEDLVGYKLEELEKHLQSTVPKGYTW